MDSGRAKRTGGTDRTTVVRDGFDWSATRPSTAVVETVTDAEGPEPTSTEPLYRTIDTDALNELVGPTVR